MLTFGIPKVEKLAEQGDVKGLLKALEYEDATVNGDRRYTSKGAALRAQAVAALGRVGRPEADAGLVRALGDPDEGVRKAALAALRDRGKEATAEALCDAVATWISEDQSRARSGALDGLIAIGPPDSAVRLADKLMARPGGSVPADRDVLRRLGESTDGGRGIPMTISHLLSVLGDPARDLRAVTMLVWLAPESVQPLIDSLAEPEKRQQASVALGYIRDERAVEPLRLLMFESLEPHASRAAAWALGRIGDSETGKDLLAAASAAPQPVEVTPVPVEPQPVEPQPVEPPPAAPQTVDGEPVESAAQLHATSQSLGSLDFDGLAELYDIAIDAWRSAHRTGDGEERERWEAVASAIVDEARGRPAPGDSEQPGRQAPFIGRRRDRRRAQLLQACSARPPEGHGDA